MNSAAWKRRIVAIAADFGCTVERTGRNHYALRHPSGWSFYCPSTPGDWREERNTIASLRRLSKGKPR